MPLRGAYGADVVGGDSCAGGELTVRQLGVLVGRLPAGAVVWLPVEGAAGLLSGGGFLGGPGARGL